MASWTLRGATGISDIYYKYIIFVVLSKFFTSHQISDSFDNLVLQISLNKNKLTIYFSFTPTKNKQQSLAFHTFICKSYWFCQDTHLREDTHIYVINKIKE